MSAAAGTPEDENYQAAVTPSEAEGSKALRPQSSCDLAGPLQNRCRIVGQDRGSWRRDQCSLPRPRLRFLDSARKDIFTGVEPCRLPPAPWRTKSACLVTLELSEGSTPALEILRLRLQNDMSHGNYIFIGVTIKCSGLARKP